jgi:general secretion pathway protein C
MLSLFGRQFWIIRLLGVATASALAGSAASSALAFVIVDRAASVFDTGDAASEDVEDELDEDTEVLAKTTVQPKPTARGAFGRQAANATLDTYNPFCPTCEPSKPTAVVLAQGPGASLPAATIATRLPLRLHVTMEAERPEHSLATIYDLERNVVGVYGVGDALREGVTVLAVSHGKVELRTPTGAELLELGAPVPEPKAEKKSEAKEPSTKTKPMAESSDLDAIQCSTADVCTVERAFVDEILANPAKFASQAPRVAPMAEGGFKLAGVRKGSLAHKLGLASGDILLAVNGTELKGLDDALGLMTKLRRASNLEVTLDRKGKSVRKQIEIR